MLDKLLPERSLEDILSGRIRVTLGGQDYILPVLSIRENRAWKEKFTGRLGLLFSDFDFPVLLGHLVGSTDQLLEMLRAYDGTNVLPPDEVIEEATEPELMTAFFSVAAAAFPLVAAALEAARRLPAPVKEEMRKAIADEMETPPSPTSSSPPSTAGRRAQRKAS